jgi:ATP-binding cassette, subfamily B, bacterial
VLHEGRVVEEGAHAELMAAGGLYAELFSLQARAYVESEPVSGREGPDDEAFIQQL